MKISCNDADIQIAAKAVNDGATVVFPTDTVYGLGCNPYNHDAVLSLYEIKKRKKTTIFVAIGLGLLGFGEIVGWYSFVFPETILYASSILIKIGGLIAIGIPVSKIPLRKISFDENL